MRTLASVFLDLLFLLAIVGGISTFSLPTIVGAFMGLIVVDIWGRIAEMTTYQAALLKLAAEEKDDRQAMMRRQAVRDEEERFERIVPARVAQAPTCPKCGDLVKPGAPKCLKCGNTLVWGRRPPATPPVAEVRDPDFDAAIAAEVGPPVRLR
jgi:hypothetical protein